MDKISDVSLVSLQESKFVKPMRMTYSQDEKKKIWDLVNGKNITYFFRRYNVSWLILNQNIGREVKMIILGGKGSVAIVIFNTDSQKFILVQQFRPAVYISNASKVLGKGQPQLKKSLKFPPFQKSALPSKTLVFYT